MPSCKQYGLFLTIIHALTTSGQFYSRLSAGCDLGKKLQCFCKWIIICRTKCSLSNTCSAQHKKTMQVKRKKSAGRKQLHTDRHLESKNEFTNLALNLKLKAQTNPCLPDATQASGNNKNRQKYYFWSRNYPCKMNRRHWGLYTHAEKHSQCFNKARHKQTFTLFHICFLPPYKHSKNSKS